jgi:hypothetical protein
MCWTPLCTNNVSKTWAVTQTTGVKDEPNIATDITTRNTQQGNTKILKGEQHEPHQNWR